MRHRADRAMPHGVGTLLASAALVAVPLTGCTDAAQVPGPTEGPESRRAESVQLRDFNVRLAACMTDNGVPAEVMDGEMGLEYSSPEGQHENVQAVHDQCVRENGGEPTPAPVSDTEIAAMYEENLRVVECLRTEGYEPVEPPSPEAFADQYTAALTNDKVKVWQPYPEPGGRVDRAALEACPQESIFDQ